MCNPIASLHSANDDPVRFVSEICSARVTVTSHTALIQEFHAGSSRLVLVVTGGGSRVIGELLSVPGASRTVLEAVVPYAPQALEDWLGHRPDQFCSRATALSMASVAWSRARRLAGPDPQTQGCLGVGCTASLVSDRPKHGDHRCWIAVQSDAETRLLSLTLAKGRRGRADEEQLVADLILTGLADSSRLRPPPLTGLTSDETVVVDVERPPALICEVRSGEQQVVWSRPGGELSVSPVDSIAGIVSGSFNPLHRGHLHLRETAEGLLQGSVAFELPVVNADKPPLDFFSIEERRGQFQKHPLALTSLPLFDQKSQVFPGVTFVIGIDTAERILQPRFYQRGSEGVLLSLNRIRSNGCRFLVAGRSVENTFKTLADLQIPSGYEDLFTAIPEEQFRDDTSSTALRRQRLSS